MSANGSVVDGAYRNVADRAEANFFSKHFPTAGSALDVPSLDAPCDSVPLQWWYANTHLKVKGEPSISFALFASFFRQCEDENPQERSVFHDACTWALVDTEKKKYYPDSLLDMHSLDVIRKRIDPEITGRPSVHAEGSLLRLVRDGKLPRPDRLMKRDAVYQSQPLVINLDDECVLKATHSEKTQSYHLVLSNPLRGVSADLTFTTSQPAVLHGDNGMVNNMFYYYFPSMSVSGSVIVEGTQREVEGVGWYDREFGGETSAAGRDALDAWTWFSLHLSNESQFSLFYVTDHETNQMKELVGIYTSKNGSRVNCSDVKMSVSENWTSLITFMDYPAECEIEVPSIALKCRVKPIFNAQEFNTVVVAGGGFFEGCVTGDGNCDGKPINVSGFLEYKNPAPYRDSEGLMKLVSRFVCKTLDQMYPLNASDQWIQKNVLGRHSTGRGTSSQRICDVLFRPVRAIIDRGGKAWRSLILVSSCNALSKDYFDCTRYIAMAELLHVGSLIIDDIQDDSVIRRGGKCVHVEYGVPTAINAGTACYFMAPFLSGVQDLPPEKANRVYQLYFDVLRAGHAGQGLDICGLDYLMPEVLTSGDVTPLFDALESIHIYKTGGAAASICAVACLLCDATEEVTEAMENFGLKLGLAFQIVDDALNIKGFEGNLKESAEDIRDGKITYPIAFALDKLDSADRVSLWTILQSRTQDPNEIQKVVDLVNKADAIGECMRTARTHITESWNRLDPLLEDSLPKIMMNTFCEFLTERTY